MACATQTVVPHTYNITGARGLGQVAPATARLLTCLPALALLARAVFYCLCTLNANTPTPTTVRASLASARTPLKPPLARL